MMHKKLSQFIIFDNRSWKFQQNLKFYEWDKKLLKKFFEK